ncbi:MAG: ABC transporter permease [Elusimicrobia bacterium]|nr:ABC transporter permease [Elusimicrobiota bacterium]
MRASDLIRGAFVEIRAHKVRSTLTCASLTVGVAAALYTLSQIGNIRERSRDAIALGGPGRLEIQPQWGYRSKGLSKGLVADDAAAIRAAFPGLYMVYPIARKGVVFSAGSFRDEDLTVVGTTDEWRRRDWVYRLRGRFLRPEDVREAARVCVLVKDGGWIKRPYWAKDDKPSRYDRYMARHDPLDKWIELAGRPFLVVGVLQEPPHDRDPRWFTGGYDGRVYVPITAFQQYFPRSSWQGPGAVDAVMVDTGKASTAARYATLISALLSYRHRGENDFKLIDYRQIISGALGRIRRYIASIAVIGIVAMLAGGIGILNVTLATVFSRVREIGVRRALGATRLDVVAQFVTEALILGTISGAAGSALGAAGVLLFSPSERQTATFSVVYALEAVAIAILVSFAFSVVPAWRASRLDPIEALRYE